MSEQTVVTREAGTFLQHHGDGFCRTVNGGAWLFMVMPDQPAVRDAQDAEARMRAARPMLSILTGLDRLTPELPAGGRRANKGLYRQIRILAVSAPRPFEPSATLDRPSRIRLRADNPRLFSHDRFTLFGVRLLTGGGRHGLRRVLDGIAEADGWAPDRAFDHDRKRIADILTAAGCTTPDETLMKRALAWWPIDAKPERLPVLNEHGHMHTFDSYAQATLAANLREKVSDCHDWADTMDHSYPLTIATLGKLPWLGNDPLTTPGSDWAATLLAAPPRGGGALAVSVGGLVEPGRLSRAQIDKDKEKVLEKAYEQASGGHKANLGVAKELQWADDIYQADGRPWPTLIEGRVHVAVSAIVEKSDQIPYPGLVTLNPQRQYSAFEDMQLGAEDFVQYNPSPVYWPAPILAFAGLNGCSMTGDDTGYGRAADLPGALVGLSEADRQPVYDSPFAPARRHTPPATLVIGGTGSGKTRLGLHLAAQWGRLPDPDRPGDTLPVVFWDPKPNSSDFEPFVRAHGGIVHRLDRDEAAGILDPLRCIPADMPDMIVQMGTLMLSQITGGEGAERAWEMGIQSIVGYGLRHGADCLGDCVALSLRARRDGSDEVSPLVERIAPDLKRAVVNDPLMRLLFATGPGARLGASSGLTLLSAGSLNVITEKEITGAPTDIQRWVCRMAAVAASCLAVGRYGAVVIDEAWSLLQDRYGRSVVNRMGRLARDQKYVFVLLSQKADEFVEAGVQDFTGKTYVLALGAKNEGAGRDSQAQAACRLTHQPLDGAMHERMLHSRWLDPKSKRPDMESLFAQEDPDTGGLLRGSIAYLQVGDEPAIPVEIRIDPSLV